VNSSFEVNSKAEAVLFYSPISLEEVFSETGLPALGLLGSSATQRAKRGPGCCQRFPSPSPFPPRVMSRINTPGGTINTTGDHAGAMLMVEEMMYSTPARSDARP
jgi:hypothetical protein